MKTLLSFLLVAALMVSVSAQSGNRSDILENLEKSSQLSQQKTVQQQWTATLKSAARLFGEKDDLTSVIMVIPSGSRVSILGSDSTYYRVEFEENEGYILKRQAVLDNSPVKENELENEIPVERKHPAQQPQNRFTYLENKYGTSLAAKLSAGKIWKGMTAEMAKDSWGSPQKINRTINGNTMKEEWFFKNTWLYFQDNILVNWGPVKR